MPREWTEWSPCDQTCGTGTRSRARPACVPTDGQPACPDDELQPQVQTESCTQPACPLGISLTYLLTYFAVVVSIIISSRLHVSASVVCCGAREMVRAMDGWPPIHPCLFRIYPCAGYSKREFARIPVAAPFTLIQYDFHSYDWFGFCAATGTSKHVMLLIQHIVKILCNFDANNLLQHFW